MCMKNMRFTNKASRIRIFKAVKLFAFANKRAHKHMRVNCIARAPETFVERRGGVARRVCILASHIVRACMRASVHRCRSFHLDEWRRATNAPVGRHQAQAPQDAIYLGAKFVPARPLAHSSLADSPMAVRPLRCSLIIMSQWIWRCRKAFSPLPETATTPKNATARDPNYNRIYSMWKWDYIGVFLF